jgi:hypothetical protein
MSLDLQNPELQKALQLIEFSNRSVFLTGKAVTGKSTFLRHIASTTKKKHVILAPTGIAAINAGGSTLHSFFKLPFHPLLPNDSRYSARNIRSTLKYNGEKVKMIRELELIIIDEISMVRADIIDFIDKVLRIYSRNMSQPFGGKQLMMVGDVYQLEPVVRDEDRQLLQPFYPSSFFFDAHVFREKQVVSIELRKVYRQSDPVFIGILDNIRTSQATDRDLMLLNARVTAASQYPSPNTQHPLSITLSTTRDTVDYINTQHLEELPGDLVVYNGAVNGDFPESMMPTPIQLELKVGAQVIFIKNDMDHRWVNGTLGIIIGLDEDGSRIYIKKESGEEVDVERDRWSNVRYTFNEVEKRIEEEEIGSYIQFPVRLAWAITVHKSQGLTFNNVKIDFGHGVFAGGQTYVALSRCTSLEGIELNQPIRHSDVFVRDEVKRFAAGYNDQRLINQALKETAADKQYHDAVKAFDRGDIDEALKQFFLAIHSRYDIEKPAPKRLLRRKLNIIPLLMDDIERLKAEAEAQKQKLIRLSVEYTLMGKECEREKMYEAAIANYKKALELYPEAQDPKRRIEKIQKKLGKENL